MSATVITLMSAAVITRHSTMGEVLEAYPSAEVAR